MRGEILPAVKLNYAASSPLSLRRRKNHDDDDVVNEDDDDDNDDIK